MSCRVQWVVFMRLKSARKVNRLLDRFFAEAIGQETAVRECERYWKDPSLFRVVVTCPLPVDDLSSALLVVLPMCWRLAPRWTLGAPQAYDGDRWEFSGSAISRGITTPGIAHIDFQACNWEQSPTESAPQPVLQKETGTAAR